MDVSHVTKKIHSLATLNNGKNVEDVSLAITFLFEALAETRRN